MINKNKLLAMAVAIIMTIIAVVPVFTSCEKLGDMVQPPFYTVVFDGNGGEGYMEKSVHEYGKTQTLSANGFSRTGYSFTGWAELPAGEVTYADRQSVRNLTKESGAVIKLYAQWDGHSYTVVYNGNGGEGIMANSVHVYGEGKALDAYAFTGWALSPDGAVVYSNRQDVTNLTGIDGGIVTLYAVWETNRIYGVLLFKLRRREYV